MKSIAVTGLGLFVPGHTSPEQLFQSLYSGKSLLKRTKIDNQESSVDIICSRIEDDQLATLEHMFPSLAEQGTSRSAKMGLHAAEQAVKQSGISPHLIERRLGLFVGCNKNLLSADLLMKLWRSREQGELSKNCREMIQADIERLDQGRAAQVVASQLGVTGRAMTFGDACTAGATAIISGQRRILSGELDVAICGATENATDPIMQTGFSKLGALSPHLPENPALVSRPFDKDRSGCVLADGAAFIVLESVEHAKKRNAKILAYLKGTSRQSEAHKLTSTEDNGYYYAHTMKVALANANLKPNDIQHINAHGTSTPSNDVAEGRAIEKIFYTDNRQASIKPAPSVTSTKSALGHSLGASAAVEAVLCIQSLLQQKVLPTLNYRQPGVDESSLDIVTQGQRQALNYVLSNSFGFGGENACLIFSEKTLQ